MRRPTVFEQRQTEADRRISELRTILSDQLASLPESDDHPDLCIYATGSLARKEATIHSDLDAFFLLSGAEKDKPLGRIRDVRILNAVLNAQEAVGFPDFSNDGAYLKFLYIDDLVNWIGHREDDYKNSFTARILLLSESTHLYNPSRYLEFKNKIIDKYFQDFHDHSRNFRPIFLLNDILRFWRTLCLNYENARHWRQDDDEIRRAKGHLDNLKLKFSRLNICYSFICHLLHQGGCLSKDAVRRTSDLTPLERLSEIADADSEAAEIIATMKSEYEWFLGVTGVPKDSALNWIAAPNAREHAFDRASKFVEATGRLVQLIAEKNGYLRYLIV